MRIARVIDTDGQERLACKDANGSLYAIHGDPLGACEKTGQTVEVKQWLPPVQPRALLCIGKNYRAHAAEFDDEAPEYPVLFMKNPAAAIGCGQPIRIPLVCDDEVDYESELAVIIGKTCCNVARENALEFVAGYTVANDVSARIWQKDKGGGQWNRGKSFDTFAPLGPVMVTPDEVPDPNNLAIQATLNGKTVQDSNTSGMIFDVRTIIAFLSEDTTLLPGTVILTGTPAGVGWARKPRLTLQPGDEIAVHIEKIGHLVNPVTSK